MKPQSEMTPQEKWERLTNPNCAADYGIGITLEEIAQVPEAVEEVSNWRGIREIMAGSDA